MNKLRRILASALLLIMAVTLTACGNSINGSWRLTGGTAMSEFLGSDISMSLDDIGMSITFSFNDGGEFEMSMSAFGMSESYSGTWTTAGDTVTMTVDGDPLVCSYNVSGDKLTLTIAENDDAGLTMIFTKD